MDKVTINLPWAQIDNITQYIESIKDMAKSSNSFEYDVPLVVYEYMIKANINAYIKVMRINGIIYTLKIMRK